MATLKQSVVIVNEFTTKTSGGGSRGSTPGDYVLRYMARADAVEDLTPVRRDTENFITRYMARDSAVDIACSVSDLKSLIRDTQGNGGVAFGYGDVSLSHKKLRESAKDIQKQFDTGKTVLKTVLSFNEDYLRQHGIVSPDFEFEKEGDYRGNIDQMKLRMAIMHGLDRLSKSYDDLQYIGVIQVDTKHVHCHLAMVDRGEGTVMPDGTQRGKLTEKEKSDIRRGIDSFLDEKQTVKMMATNVDYDKRNTICYVKKYTHQVMKENGMSQFLLACLPEDRSLWRASTNRAEMQKANSIMKEYVTDILSHPDSGYDEALKKVDAYATARTRNEGLTGEQYRKLCREGQRRIIESSMNSVYDVLKTIPEEDISVSTPMMNAMAMPYREMADYVDSDPMIEFGFKLRSYKSRLDHHKSEMHKYHDAAKSYEAQQEAGNTDASSRPLYDYFKAEEEYNLMLMSKYQHFLQFIPPEDEYMDGLSPITDYRKRIENITSMRNDVHMYQMSASGAEEYGIRTYNEVDGHYMTMDPNYIDNKISSMRTQYLSMKDEYNVKLLDYGLRLDQNDQFVKYIPYKFDDVKAIDLHHMRYDFTYEFNISNDNADKFIEAADKRYNAFIHAKDYLIRTGQADMCESFPEKDIMAQHDMAEQFKSNDMTVLRIGREEDKAMTRLNRPAKTVRIDYDLYYHHDEEIRDRIKDTVNSIQYE